MNTIFLQCFCSFMNEYLNVINYVIIPTFFMIFLLLFFQTYAILNIWFSIKQFFLYLFILTHSLFISSTSFLLLFAFFSICLVSAEGNCHLFLFHFIHSLLFSFCSSDQDQENILL